MQWTVDDDTLEACRGADDEVPKKVTQWAVLSFVASVSDPLGLFAPFTMRMRILLKAVWAKRGQQWDDQIDQKYKENSVDCTRELPEIKNMPLKRR